MNLPDLLGSSLSSREDRATHGGLHVSDLANGCVKAVWHRIQRGTDAAFSPLVRKKMEYGHAWEEVVRRHLISSGVTLRAPEVVIFKPDLTVEKAPAESFDTEPRAFANYVDLVGHPDIVTADGQVIEVKTTMLFRQGYNAPAHPPLNELRVRARQYLLQTAAYAKAYDARTGLLYVSDRGTGIDAQYDVDTDQEWATVLDRWEEMKLALNPKVEPDPAPPAWTIGKQGSYLCKSCPVRSCSLNATKED